MSTEPHDPLPAWRNLALWTGLLGGPIAWFIQLVVVYALAVWVNAGHSTLLLHLAALLCLLAGASCGWLAWRNWQIAGRGWPDDTDEGKLARVRLLSVVGLMTGTLFLLVMLVQWLAVSLLSPSPM